MPTMNLAAFIAHVSASITHLNHHQHQAMERACVVVETEAKHEIGNYQGQTGPFVAWAELADATKDDRVRKRYPENEPLLREGDMRDSIDHAASFDEGVVGSDSPIAEYQELGTAHIPARSFLGGAASRKGPAVAHILGQSAVRALVGDQVVNKMLPIP